MTLDIGPEVTGYLDNQLVRPTGQKCMASAVSLRLMFQFWQFWGILCPPFPSSAYLKGNLSGLWSIFPVCWFWNLDTLYNHLTDGFSRSTNATTTLYQLPRNKRSNLFPYLFHLKSHELLLVKTGAFDIEVRYVKRTTLPRVTRIWRGSLVCCGTPPCLCSLPPCCMINFVATKTGVLWKGPSWGRKIQCNTPTNRSLQVECLIK